jgi:hypothetical protein
MLAGNWMKFDQRPFGILLPRRLSPLYLGDE